MISFASTVRLASGHAMPRLGFGVFQSTDAKASVLEALKAGYRHVDSAQYYKNEAEVADAIRASGVPREDVFVTTKIMSSNHGYESTLKGVNESLKKMKFDYIDLFLIHDPLSGAERRLATYRALLESKTAGKIRSVGVSNYNVHHIEEIKKAGYEMPSVNQIELHPFLQQREIVKYCNENNIVVQAYCPIVQGKMDNPAINALATKYDRDRAHILLRWSLQKGFVPLPKSDTPSRIHSNTKLYDFELTEEDVQKLDALDRGKAGAVNWNPVDTP